jgi:hypothetical protein
VSEHTEGPSARTWKGRRPRTASSSLFVAASVRQFNTRPPRPMNLTVKLDTGKLEASVASVVERRVAVLDPFIALARGPTSQYYQ